jgi:hypothetical protein
MWGIVANLPMLARSRAPIVEGGHRPSGYPEAAHPCYGTARVSSQSHRHMPNPMARRISEATCFLAWLGSTRTRLATTQTPVP